MDLAGLELRSIKISDLLEELFKRREENIVFYLTDMDGNTKALTVLSYDGKTILEVRDNHGKPINTVALTFWDENAKTNIS